MASVDKYEKTTASAKTLRKIRKRLVSIDETCSVNIQPTGNTGKPKRPYPNRVVKSKYDAVVFDLKMAQTALDNRNKEINGWVKQNNELRAEIEKDRQLYRDVLNERDKYKESAEINGKAAHDMLRDYEKVLLDIGKVTAERDRLRAENDELKHKASELNKAYSAANEALYYASENWNACAKSLQVLKREMEEEKIAAFELKAAEHANLDTLARKLRDQRDTALFLAALFFLASAGFAVAVLIGRLIPVY